jgi:hypothetical protein
VQETDATLSCGYTLHFKGVKYLYFKIIFKISCRDYFVVWMCCGSGVSVIYNGLYYCFVYKVNILCYILLFYHCSRNVT